jgi:putative RNA 2'-phosphotransferase
MSKYSRLLSLVLRHKPEYLNLHLDYNGYAFIDDVIRGFKEKGYHLSREELERIVKENDKQRFSFDKTYTKIRANQGHSIDVNLSLDAITPPDVLYHGSYLDVEEKIKVEGIKRMTRNYVQLSINIDEALIVGSRHGEPIVYWIDAKRMMEDGYHFYLSKNGIYMTRYIPVGYFHLIEKKDHLCQTSH